MKAIWLSAAVLCIGILLVSFIMSLCRLRKSRLDVERAREHLAGYRRLQAQAEQREQFQTQVEISEVIYGDAIGIYNRTLQKPLCRMWGCLLGFRPAGEDGEP